jgi:hypothetical protein
MNLFHCPQFNTTLQNFYQNPSFTAMTSQFANFTQNFAAMNAFMTGVDGSRGHKKESHKKKKHSGKRRAGEVESSTVYESETKRQRTDLDASTGFYQNEVLKTPENKQLKGGAASKRELKSSTKIQLNIESD